MIKKLFAGCLENVAYFTVNLFSQGICFFLFHQPPFPEKAREIKKCNKGIKDGKNS